MVTVVATGALWFYHHRLTADDKLSHDGLSRVVHQLYMLGFGGTGLTVAVVGFVSFQMWVFDRLNDDMRSSLPSTIAMMAAGALLWLYHEWARALDTKMKDVAADVLRWLYATLFSSVGVIMSLVDPDNPASAPKGTLVGQDWTSVSESLVSPCDGPTLVIHVQSTQLPRHKDRKKRWFVFIDDVELTIYP